MSISQKMEELRPYIDVDGLDAFKELRTIILPYEPEFQLERFQAAMLDEVSDDALHEMLDQLEISTARYTRVSPERRRTFKTDLLRYFTYCHQFIDKDMREVLCEYIDLYYKIFSTSKKICGLPNYTCSVPGCPGKFDDGEQIICLTCGGHRTLCKNSPVTNGRCRRIKVHGGQKITGSLNDKAKKFGRVTLYEESLNGELRDMFVEAVTDPNYLSVAPEMGALATRSAQLMGEIGDTDYIAIAASAQQSIRKMRKAYSEQDYSVILDESRELENLLTSVANDKRRWDEIAALSGRLGRLVEVERKRLVEEQKMITVQEMYLLQQETLGHIRDSASIVAAEIVKMINKNGVINTRSIRQMFLTTLHGVLKGDIDAGHYLEDGTETVVIDAE